MRKSVPAFILSLVWSLIGAAVALIFSLIFTLVFGLAGALAGKQIGNAIIYVCYANIATFAVSFIASFFCFKFARVAGVLMVCSALASFGCMIAIFVILKMFDFKIMLFWIPTLFILISGIIGIVAKKQQPKLI